MANCPRTPRKKLEVSSRRQYLQQWHSTSSMHELTRLGCKLAAQTAHAARRAACIVKDKLSRTPLRVGACRTVSVHQPWSRPPTTPLDWLTGSCREGAGSRFQRGVGCRVYRHTHPHILVVCVLTFLLCLARSTHTLCELPATAPPVLITRLSSSDFYAKSRKVANVALILQGCDVALTCQC
jgi:hypothetical protein